MRIDLSELGLAYRRVKSDLYYTRNANLFKLLKFEKELSKNLRYIQDVLSREAFSELDGDCFGYRLIPKDVKFQGEQVDDDDNDATGTDGDNRDVECCELRIIEDVPISFHVVTQLWIDRVGYKLEDSLSDAVYGYRLRRHDKKINKKYPGTFKHYISQYRKWHDGGLDKIALALKDKKRVVVMTADFTAFYHTLTPDFLLNPSYLKEIGAQNIYGDDLILTQLVVRMLNTWARNTPLGIGFPVGCSISSVIANLALAAFDNQIGNIHDKIYYGRYVDDIILAVENSGEINKKSDFIKLLVSKINGFKQNNGDLEYSNPKLILPLESILRFNKRKVRIFFFDPEGGDAFINTLKNQIGKRTSEWRALPELPDNPEKLIQNIVSITDSKGLEVDKLRQAEAVSIRRAAFAMKLSDLGDYATYLPSQAWRDQRLAFLNAVGLYFCTIKSYFELYVYFPRLIGLTAIGMSLEDYESQSLIKDIYHKVKTALEKAFSAEIKIAGKLITDLNLRRDAVVELVNVSVCAGFRETLSAAVEDTSVRTKLYSDLGSVFLLQKGMVETSLPEYDELFLADLALVPYKEFLLSVHDRLIRKINFHLHPLNDIDSILPYEYLNFVSKFLSKQKKWMELLRSNAISGLLFPTRSIKPIELCSVLPQPYTSTPGSRDIIIDYMRLMNYGGRDVDFTRLDRHSDGDISIVWTRPEFFTKAVQGNTLSGNKNTEYRPKVALAYWRMKDSAWYDQLRGKPKNELQREFTRLMRFLNRLTRSNVKIDYVVFPELAMPWRWFLMIATELKKRNISLISGVQYLFSTKKDEVSNEAWCSLMTNGMGYPDSTLIRVLKTAPAEHERSELKMEGYSLRTRLTSREFRAGDVIRHGNNIESFYFSVLICSDLTNIKLRSKLRGKIDALFIPAWNKDVETFNSLVMASAFDLHSYVILANNGEFGDVRIRAPMHERYRRDILQLNGGEYDYFVVGMLDIGSLRRAQANCSVPRDSRYKSVPIGYRMSEGREARVRRKSIDFSSLDLKYVKIEDGYCNVMWFDVDSGEYVDVDYKVFFSDIDTKRGLISWVAKALKMPYVSKDTILEVVLVSKVLRGEGN